VKSKGRILMGVLTFRPLGLFILIELRLVLVVLGIALLTGRRAAVLGSGLVAAGDIRPLRIFVGFFAAFEVAGPLAQIVFGLLVYTTVCES
jgi:hypothetical protein